MMRFVSRIDFFYMAAFLASILAMFVGGAFGLFLADALVSPPDASDPGLITSELEQANLMRNTIGIAGSVMVYGASFFVLARGLNRLGAGLKSNGVRLGALISAALLAALLLSTANVTVLATNLPRLSVNWAVWIDVLTFIAAGGVYVLALFLARHLSRFTQPNGKRKGAHV